jgi:hypothetical protein
MFFLAKETPISTTCTALVDLAKDAAMSMHIALTIDVHSGGSQHDGAPVDSFAGSLREQFQKKCAQKVFRKPARNTRKVVKRKYNRNTTARRILDVSASSSSSPSSPQNSQGTSSLWEELFGENSSSY